MVKTKKAAIGIQVNWLFVLIAGAVILMIVFAFIVKQKRSSQIKAADTLLKDIEAITTGTVALKGGSQQITLPKTDVNFECTEDCVCTINVGPLSKDYKEKQIFAPAVLKGLKAVTLTKGWEIPFRAANFLYITDISSKYYFIYENPTGPLKQLIEAKFPKGINHEFVEVTNLENLRNTGFDNTRFVFLNAPINTNIDKSFRKTSSFITLSDSTIGFQGKQPVIYISEAEFFGAIFADNYNMYVCNLEKAKQRADFIIEIYKERAKELDQLASAQNLLCGYDDIIAEFEALENDKNIVSHYNQIKNLNEELVVASCPLVY